MADVEPDPQAIARVEARLELLDELSGITMERVRRLPRGAEEVEGGGDPIEAHILLARSARLTVALAQRLEADLAALKEGRLAPSRPGRGRAGGPAKADDADPAADALAQTRHNHIRKAFELVRNLNNAITPSRTMEDLNAQYGRFVQLNEYLYEKETCDIDPDWPLRKIIENLCDHLGLKPDWSQWTGEGWPGVAPALGLATLPTYRGPFRPPADKPHEPPTAAWDTG
jgi:hypothetical protein